MFMIVMADVKGRESLAMVMCSKLRLVRYFRLGIVYWKLDLHGESNEQQHNRKGTLKRAIS
jgi:hypothetical protein